LKYKITSITSLLILLFFSPVYFTSGDYQVSIGQTFSYDVINAELTISLDDEYFSGNGFELESHFFTQGTSISIEVISFGLDNLIYSITSSSFSENRLADWTFIDENTLSKLLINPMQFIENPLSNISLVTKGLGLYFFPFVKTISINDFFQSFANGTHYQLIFYNPKINDLYFDTKIIEASNLIYFNFVITGVINNTSPNYTIDFTHESKITYDTSTGVLQGMWFYSEGSGIFDNQSLEYSFESHTEIENYDLPGFYSFNLTKNCLILIFVMIALSFIFVLLIISIRIKRK